MSKLIQSKAEFQQMAEERLAKAKGLLDLGKWAGSYYLAGYAVELALKACIIKIVMETDAFLDKDFSKNCYVHDIDKLVKLARLDGPRKTATEADEDLKDYWSVSIGWSEEKQYHWIEKKEAEDLYKAIADNAHGVLPWIKAHW